MRVNPVSPGNTAEPGAVDHAEVILASQKPGTKSSFPARDIVDAGFLQLVRYGILEARDPLIVSTLGVIDKVLKVDTPFGPVWRRYNHDDYGQRPDGGPYADWGKGRGWPLLTGERGHYELAAGNDWRPYLQTMERLASSTGLLPEQVWDEADLPDANLFRGKPTGSAMPLLWAHSEYIRLLRSCQDGTVISIISDPPYHRVLGKTTSNSLHS